MIRPNETPYSWKDVKGRDSGSFLMKQLEDAGFTPRVEVRSVTGTVSATSLDELVSNMMLPKDMFWKGYSEEEIKKAEPVLKEQIKGLATYRETEGGVEIGTVAWIGIGWK